jgi:hypothetical protein
MSSDISDNSLPPAITELVQQALQRIRTHPQHEFGQALRRKMYEILWPTTRGRRTCQWLAILAVRRAEPIYEREMLASNRYGEDTEYCAGLVGRILSHAELVVRGELTADEVKLRTQKGEFPDYYHEILIAFGNQLPSCVWLAALGADNAFDEVMGDMPLQNSFAR